MVPPPEILRTSKNQSLHQAGDVKGGKFPTRNGINRIPQQDTINPNLPNQNGEQVPLNHRRGSLNETPKHLNHKTKAQNKTENKFTFQDKVKQQPFTKSSASSEKCPSESLGKTSPNSNYPHSLSVHAKFTVCFMGNASALVKSGW